MALQEPKSRQSDPSDLRLVLRVDFPPDDRLGWGKAQLLENIRATGSISAAGRAMDMSYRRAWLLVDEMNKMFRDKVVESQRGGVQGGGAVLTGFGEELLAHFRNMEAKITKTLKDDIAWLERHRSASGATIQSYRDNCKF